MLSLIAKTLLQGALYRHGNTHFLSWEELTLGCVIWLQKKKKKGAGFMAGIMRKIFLRKGRVNNNRKANKQSIKIAKAEGCRKEGPKT